VSNESGSGHGIHLTVNQATGKPGKFLAIATNGVGELHRDTIDLNSAISRKRFLGGAMRAAFPQSAQVDWPENVQEDLERQLLDLAKCPPGPPMPPPVATDPAAEDPRIDALAKMPDDVRAEAIALLDDPRLLERIAADLQKRGIVGERLNALTIYLAAVSTQLRKPLSIIMKGLSASGKSYIVACVADLFPPEVVLAATSLTTNALYYFKPGTLRHRWIVAGERSRIEDDDRAEATRALREMIESGRLSKAVPVKQNDGHITTELVEQEGPISFIETTTLGNIFEEDANRCLLISTDECEEQTERILKATAATAAGHQRPDLERLRAVHHAIQRMLPRCDVTIPFAEHIAALYPIDRLDARRSFRHLLVLVKASALLFHRQRNRDAAGNVVATIDDYAVAEDLARIPFSTAASGVSDGACKFLTALGGKFGIDKEFSTADAQLIGTGSRRARYGRLNELHGVGAVEQTQPSKGKVPARWKITGIDPNAGPGVLPNVQEVLGRLTACTDAHKPQVLSG
jgi:hypothetical protein